MGNWYIRAIVAAVTVAVLVLAAGHGAIAAVSCDQVRSAIAPCLSYVSTNRGNPSDRCCEGVRNLNELAATPEDRRAVCTCLKNIVAGTPLNDDAVANLPAKCGVQLPYTISPSTDCSSV
ncbi:hypothetical protein LUZ61_008210 [Rhynchospora tenuis]|uniref:Non-specific lipid-transfer protein n=1 Tax=Rhynchospora tenuis TaxID=198213 RepID=A0AAD5ZUV0_9POAL|nr:hypothetical protein LUZ61_008210 [Rhynchospora tenuis]